MSRKLLKGAVGIIATSIVVGIIVSSLSVSSKPEAQPQQRKLQMTQAQADQRSNSSIVERQPQRRVRPDALEVRSVSVEADSTSGAELAANDSVVDQGSAATAAAGPHSVAKAIVEPERISWEPLAENYGSVHLRVTGPGIAPYETTFAQGEDIQFGFFGDDGNIWADGLYNWEITSAPQVSEETREFMREVREVVSADNAREVLHFNGVHVGEGKTQSGSFRILDGEPLLASVEEVVEEPFAEEAALVADAGSFPSDLDEGVQLRDIVHSDDVIINGGSLCVGFDCVNGESFGFDTIKLKENNLRIRFEDTSTSASFPSRDWQIVANETTNGGANKFSIEDVDGSRMPFTIEAGAPSHSLYVDDGGRIGVGTSTPVVELHVRNGDSPTLRLEQDGSSGFTPQTWDLAGNETNFFVRDATNGSRLPFKIRPSAPTNSLYVDTDGDVGIGTATPDARLHVDTNSGEPSFLVSDDGVADSTQLVVTEDGDVGIGVDVPGTELHVKGSEVRIDNTGTTTTAFLRMSNDSGAYSVGVAGTQDEFILFDRGSSQSVARYRAGGNSTWKWFTNGVENMELDVNGDLTTTGTVNGVSDRNAKQNIERVEPETILEKVVDLPISEWSYKKDKENKRHIGPMAQDFRAQFGLGDDDKTIALSDVSGVALAAIKGLHEVVKEKDAEIQSLRERTEAMEAQLKMLMEKIGASAE